MLLAKEFVEYARKNDTNVGTWGPGCYAHIVVAGSTNATGCRSKQSTTAADRRCSRTSPPVCSGGDG
jgi:hypothetical protein